ncbi:coat protein [Rubus canadensis virus 1]|uniref:Capsid protein n=1 Tax=Rubus canadensis virus 1 TaxID=1243178 RepID=K4MQK1_9VIRU|nr:coat protein [Rubus canadensis virus 1]AFV31421.1 coat protein [Rubus canadensis virus 1]
MTSEKLRDLEKKLSELATDSNERAGLEKDLKAEKAAIAAGSVSSDKKKAARIKQKFSGSSITSIPTNKMLREIKISTEVRNVCSLSNAELIAAEFVELGIPEDKLAEAAWDLALHCADVGSSELTELAGTCTFAPNVTRSDMGAVVKSICTLRQFCSLYAKIVWNIMITCDRPPANFLKRNHKWETRFAAFDFFDAVLNPAALEPEGDFRRPNNEEITAAETVKRIAINRQEVKKGNAATSSLEVTGGRMGPVAVLAIKDK